MRNITSWVLHEGIYFAVGIVAGFVLAVAVFTPTEYLPW